MKALSIKQPWAWAILTQGKDVENRDWHTHFRGTIAIHASKGMTNDEFEQAAYFMKYGGPGISYKLLPNPMDIPRGGIVGLVDIIDCVSSSLSPWFVGDYGFVLANPRQLSEPIPCKGALGFWNVPLDLVDQLTRARIP